MCKAQVTTTLVIILQSPHTSKVDLKPVEHGGNTLRGSCGLVEVQYQFQAFSPGALSICFEGTFVFPLPKLCDSCSNICTMC